MQSNKKGISDSSVIESAIRFGSILRFFLMISAQLKGSNFTHEEYKRIQQGLDDVQHELDIIRCKNTKQITPECVDKSSKGHEAQSNWEHYNNILQAVTISVAPHKKTKTPNKKDNYDKAMKTVQ